LGTGKEQSQQLEELKSKIKTLESYIETKSSELNKAKLEAEKISSYMNAVFECTPDAIVVTDLSGKMTLGNETAKKLLGNFIDQNISKFINLKKASFDGSSAISAECELITASGPIPVTLTSGSLIQGSDLQGHVYTFHDVRDARNAQAALEEAKSDSAAKSQFLANMSHEIRTPLNSVIGLSDYLIETSDFGENNQYLQQIRTSGVALLAIVNDVLDISKIEAGELNLEKVAFEIKAPIMEVLDIFSHQAKSKNLYLVHEIGESVGANFIGDPSRIRQIIMNFVSNALKFTKSGGIEIRIDPPLNCANGFRISIVDTGMGISSSVMDKLFSPFKQGDDSTTRKFGGTGLGLSITKHLAELMGGMVGVESTEGKGSKFWAELPLEPTTIEKTEELSDLNIEFDEFGLNSIKQYRPANILVAEDNPANQMVVKAMLGKLGHSVTIANNGVEAIQLFSLDGFYDIILMDFQMPEMGGIEACKEIRSQNNGLKIPIIAMTASALRHEVTAAKAAGMNDFLGKPVTMAELQRVVEKWAPISKQLTQVANNDTQKLPSSGLDLDFSGLD
jgi:signal transduction histidine kinase/AmiR/NasT family two-component response regulator